MINFKSTFSFAKRFYKSQIELYYTTGLYSTLNPNLSSIGPWYLEDKQQTNNSNEHFYRRKLPACCLAFSSEEGKQVFKESLLSGYANIYFPLAEQFRTQAEPAYCGISTLVMILNSLAVDPKRVWKGPWRWYHEEMLDCCLSLDLVQQNGITLDQFVCLATCNNLDLNVVRTDDNENIKSFRDVVEEICAGQDKVLTCSYSRSVLNQTGGGHFSPIGAYHPKKDLVLIFDVARFKYPPHWVKLDLLWEAMKALDGVTGLPRGYIVLRKTEEMPLLLFRLSNIFRVTIATNSVSQSSMAKFMRSWRTFLKNGSVKIADSLDVTIGQTLAGLNEALKELLEGDSVFNTQFNTHCIDTLPPDHISAVRKLLASLENTEIYQIIHSMVSKFKKNFFQSRSNFISNQCTCIERVGKPFVNEIDTSTHDGRKVLTTKTNPSTLLDNSKELVTDSHFITMLILCWPYSLNNTNDISTYLARHVEKVLLNGDDLLVNEVKQLRHQIQSLLELIKRNPPVF
ncbi:uncharacterized protein LOC100213020 isoform X3 [Hydra vulgaris]|uniref:glutathione gamma-glutamylcysteinyltransferase n=1 Tax=Hydra vulgaris TaxID=6087 RepID=A0ABM4D4X5_HYDVU